MATRNWKLPSRIQQVAAGWVPVKCSDLIYDWNKVGTGTATISKPVLLNDETLRDGLQSPSVRDPSILEKIEILHFMEDLGINSLDLGLPGSGPRAVAHVENLAREIVRCGQDQSQLRGPHPPERHPSDCRNRAAHRASH
jgi:hypothetical protein